jgi:hypothetical protein
MIVMPKPINPIISYEKLKINLLVGIRFKLDKQNLDANS